MVNLNESSSAPSIGRYLLDSLAAAGARHNGFAVAQMTVQELGTLAREGLDPIVVVVSNSGYTIERAIGGRTASYNDIHPWNWQLIPAALGTGATVSSAATVARLDAALDRAAADGGRLRFIEVLLDRDDVPAMLAGAARALAERSVE
jgi:alpha-keto-acid decarboxylase